MLRPLFVVILASLAARAAADMDTGDDIAMEMRAERSQATIVNSDGTFADAEADDSQSDDSKSNENGADEELNETGPEIQLKIPTDIEDRPDALYFYSGLKTSFYNIPAIFKRIQCDVEYNHPHPKLELEAEDWIGFFGIGSKYLSRTVRHWFTRDLVTATFELSPFWNTTMNFSGCKKITCTETRFDDENNKVEAERLAIFGLALAIVVFCRNLSHFGLLHYVIAGTSSVFLMGLLLGIFFWNRMSGESAVFGGLGAGATGMGFVFGGDKAKESVKDLWDRIKIFVLYATTIFFVFSIWLFHGFKTNQLACCGDTRSKLLWISSLMEYALYIAGCAIIYSYTTSSAVLAVILVGVALVTSFVVNRMDLFGEHFEVQDKRRFHNNLEVQSSCWCCRGAKRELTPEEEDAAHTRDAVQELMMSAEGRAWTSKNRSYFDKNPPPENMTEYHAWVAGQIGGDEVHVMRRRAPSRCVIS